MRTLILAFVATADAARARRFYAELSRRSEGDVDGRHVAIGNERFFESHRIPLPTTWPDADRLRANGKSLVFVAADGVALGAIAAAHLLEREGRAAASESSSPLAPKKSHFPGTAKNVIFLFMPGGPIRMGPQLAQWFV
jgi:hypothetical protein